jgi:peptidoglycan/xylan/chitin deacetylase (PgdA/CDA1 family)
VGNPKFWALTYDDGPGPFTSAFLDALDKNNIKATLFVTGQQVVMYPQLLKRASDAGHEIGWVTFIPAR